MFLSYIDVSLPLSEKERKKEDLKATSYMIQFMWFWNGQSIRTKSRSMIARPRMNEGSWLQRFTRENFVLILTQGYA